MLDDADDEKHNEEEDDDHDDLVLNRREIATFNEDKTNSKTCRL